eukprot:TRINITY_DN14134_c0_g1_i1.p2 TRINITY_DN14134_c0_g1~~TRINITY_DN14134_c0_g1_i1.p2  ORF type:complete len:110 (-),score=14.21 TRINITY_DN14134_c0_g1_i1:253-558(-)
MTRRMSVGREDTPERRAKLARLDDVKKQIAQVDAQLQQYAQVDPQRLQQMAQATRVCKDSANRWTDNVFILKKYYQGKMYSLTNKEFFGYFGLPEDFDYLE